MQEICRCDGFAKLNASILGEVTNKLIAMPMIMESGIHDEYEVCVAHSVHFYACKRIDYRYNEYLSVRPYCIICKTDKEVHAVDTPLLK